MASLSAHDSAERRKPTYAHTHSRTQGDQCRPALGGSGTDSRPAPVPGPRSPSCRHRLWRIPWGRRSRRAGTRHRAWRHHRTRRLPERGGRSAGQATVGHPISPTRPIGLPGFACPDGPLGRRRSCRRRHRCCRAAQPGCRDAGQCRRPEHRGRRRSGCARRPGALCCRPAIGAGDRGAIASPQTRVRAKSEQRGRAGAAGRHDTERAGLGAVARPCGRAPRRRRPGRRRPERRFAHPRGDRPADRPRRQPSPFAPGAASSGRLGRQAGPMVTTSTGPGPAAAATPPPAGVPTPAPPARVLSLVGRRLPPVPPVPPCRTAHHPRAYHHAVDAGHPRRPCRRAQRHRAEAQRARSTLALLQEHR